MSPSLCMSCTHISKAVCSYCPIKEDPVDGYICECEGYNKEEQHEVDDEFIAKHRD